MSDKNLAAVLFKKGDLKPVERPIPEPRAGEVQLRMQQVGICGSDITLWKHGSIGHYIVKTPLVLGHEASGVVSKLGDGVTTLKIGDRVAIEPGVPCRFCEYCKSGKYNLCPDIKFCSAPPDDGTLSRYCVHPADFCFKLPDHVSYEEGALLEPLSVAVRACDRSGVTLGSRVLICGAGPIGLLMLLTAKAKGAVEVCITDINSSRLETARKLGATYTLNVTGMDPHEEARQVEMILGSKAEITIECSGAATSIQATVYATRSGGCVMLVGLGQAEVTMPVLDATLREVNILGTERYANCYHVALAMIGSGKVDVKPLVTHRFPLEDSIKAFETTFRAEGIKVMINCAQ